MRKITHTWVHVYKKIVLTPCKPKNYLMNKDTELVKSRPKQKYLQLHLVIRDDLRLVVFYEPSYISRLLCISFEWFTWWNYQQHFNYSQMSQLCYRVVQEYTGAYKRYRPSTWDLLRERLLLCTWWGLASVVLSYIEIHRGHILSYISHQRLILYHREVLVSSIIATIEISTYKQSFAPASCNNFIFTLHWKQMIFKAGDRVGDSTAFDFIIRFYVDFNLFFFIIRLLLCFCSIFILFGNLCKHGVCLWMTLLISCIILRGNIID